MAVRLGNNGEMQIVLKVKDDGSVVFETFGKTSEKAGEKASKGFDKARKSVNKYGKELKIAALALAATATLMVKTFTDAASEAEQYRVRLVHLLGSVQEGNRLFADMVKFASKVPFEYRDIMGSATALAGVMQGGVNQIDKWMPMIADLAAVSGLSIRDTTDQVIRMYSAGAASADLFRERGILAMLGFQAGVSYSAEDTRKKLIAAWEDPASKFRGSTIDLAKTWKGLTSMVADDWFRLRTQLMDAGLFNYLKAIVIVIHHDFQAAFKAVDKDGKTWVDNIIAGIEGAARVVGIFADGIRGIHVLFKLAEIVVIGFGSAVLTVFEQLSKLWQSVTEHFKWAKPMLKAAALMNPMFAGFALAADHMTTHFGLSQEKLAKMAEASRQLLIKTEHDTQQLLMSGLPSDAIKKKLAEIRVAYDRLKASAHAAGKASGEVVQTGPIGSPQGTALAGQQSFDSIYGKGYTDVLEKRVQALQQTFMTEDQVATQHYEDQRFMVEDAFQAQLMSEQQHNQLLEQLELQHQARMGDITAQGLLKRQKFSAMSTLQQTNFALGQMVRMTEGVATSNKTMFEINKVAGIANATISMFKGIELTRAAYPYPWNIPMVALYVASSLANIAKLKAASYGTSTSAATVAGGGAQPVQNFGSGMGSSSSAPPSRATPPPQPKHTFNFYLPSDPHISQWVRDAMIPELEKAAHDGAFNADIMVHA